MTFLDFFAGIGGFRLGMEMAGHECLGHCEIDKYANKSYAAMHNPRKGEWFADNIRDVEPGDLPEADCYCFGFPCQTFSIAGNRGGFEDTRGTLFFEVMRLARVRKPKYLFAENVAGLLSHDGGRTFGTILRTLGELGYWWEYQVLNSKDFGVPHNRERVFIVGHFRNERGREIFPVTGQGNEYTTIGESAETAIARTLTCGGHSAGNHSGMTVLQIANVMPTKTRDNPNQGRVYDSDGIAPCLNKMDGGGREPLILDDQGRKNKKITPIEICPTLRAQAHGNDPKVAIPCLTPDRVEKRQNGRRFKENGDPMFTITAQDKHGVYDGMRIRKLTPRECFRLQGFPDEYFERAKSVNSDSQLYKQAGNSVTVNVIYEIAQKLGK